MNKQTFEHHPLTGYRFIPGLQTRIQHETGGYLLKTNSTGFRSDAEFDSKKKEGVKRILLFGDSFTAGDGVSNKKRYSDQLMQMLPGTEIYNFGMPGTGTDQQYLLYKEYAKNIEHDMVMIVVLVENIRRVNAKYRYYYNEKNEKTIFHKPFYELVNNELVLKNTPVNPVQLRPDELSEEEKAKVDERGRFPAIRGLINKIGLKQIAQKLTKFQPLPEYNSSNSKEWLLMKTILVKWLSELEKPVLLVPLPLYHYVEELSDYKEVEKRFAELGHLPNVTIFDPLTELKKYPMEERRNFRFPEDIHPTPAGHEAYAKALLPHIKKILTTVA